MIQPGPQSVLRIAHRWGLLSSTAHVPFIFGGCRYVLLQTQEDSRDDYSSPQVSKPTIILAKAATSQPQVRVTYVKLF